MTKLTILCTNNGTYFDILTLNSFHWIYCMFYLRNSPSELAGPQFLHCCAFGIMWLQLACWSSARLLKFETACSLSSEFLMPLVLVANSCNWLVVTHSMGNIILICLIFFSVGNHLWVCYSNVSNKRKTKFCSFLNLSEKIIFLFK